MDTTTTPHRKRARPGETRVPQAELDAAYREKLRERGAPKSTVAQEAVGRAVGAVARAGKLPVKVAEAIVEEAVARLTDAAKRGTRYDEAEARRVVEAVVSGRARIR